MDDKNFKKMDESWMKKMAPLRDKKISEGILKGFSASVERRLPAGRQGIASNETPLVKHQLVFRPIWAPVAAVMVLASFIVLRSPITLSPSPVPMELAQVTSGSADDVQEEIEVLKELGVWDEVEDETMLNTEEWMDMDLELTRIEGSQVGIA